MPLKLVTTASVPATNFQGLELLRSSGNYSIRIPPGTECIVSEHNKNEFPLFRDHVKLLVQGGQQTVFVRPDTLGLMFRCNEVIYIDPLRDAKLTEQTKAAAKAAEEIKALENQKEQDRRNKRAEERRRRMQVPEMGE